ncbi:ABC-2 transporter permease [Facklamia miroungae]|uniref:ABC-2 family transporter protein n=1 Tax=Facklamia miroungae TaxID=120956 RepID=A0A1G7U2Z1_9LACT|nr:ABC-2 transporter permease [Facklamia miroungae]NKZ29861.1 ABC-2 transporter permease [Facklamia miroungae]SDG41170.1 ABC-2 family transporter protein [Facklamia miroungae]
MKGLLYKDWLFIRKTKLRILLPLIMIYIFLYIKSGEIVLMSIISMTVLISILPTITYDDSDNGMSMLSALPYTRQDYVCAKYLSSIIIIVLLFVFQECLTSVVALFQNVQTFNFMDNSLNILMILAATSITLWILLPIQLKFGAEKTQLIIFSLIIFCMIGATFLFLTYPFIWIDVSKMLKGLFSNKWNRLITSILAMGITYFISLTISLRIMQRREF